MIDHRSVVAHGVIIANHFRASYMLRGGRLQQTALLVAAGDMLDADFGKTVRWCSLTLAEIWWRRPLLQLIRVDLTE